MWFKNLYFFAFTRPFECSEEDLEKQLQESKENFVKEKQKALVKIPKHLRRDIEILIERARKKGEIISDLDERFFKD